MNYTNNDTREVYRNKSLFDCLNPFERTPSWRKEKRYHVDTLVFLINEHARSKRFWSFSSLLALSYYIKTGREDTPI